MTNFGVYLRVNHDHESIFNLALRSEELGFHSLWVNDHLIGFDPERKQDYLEAFILMTYIASKTTRVRVGHSVLCNSFRNPALLGKMVSTLDVLSGGRVEIGIGAGWYKEEYEAYGFEFPSPKERVLQLRETLLILKEMFTKERFDFKGRYWNLKNCINNPKPVQKPHPPIWVGGEKPSTIRLAAEFGDGYNMPHSHFEVARRQLEILKGWCDDMGRSYERMKKSWFGGLTITKTSKEAREIAKERATGKVMFQEILQRSFIGTPEELISKLERFRDELGVELFIFGIHASESIRDPLSFFADEISSQF
ncbi:MAG: LLM class flavin-dependent oxidoreductase [Candidatus Methanofastidiosia archaeon]